MTAEASATAGRRIEVDFATLQHGGHAILRHPVHIKLEGGIAAECLAVPCVAAASVAAAASAGTSVSRVPKVVAAAAVAATGAGAPGVPVDATAVAPLREPGADRPEHADGLEHSNPLEHDSD